MTISDNLTLQRSALQAAAEGQLVLTATGRLARHLLHRDRLERPGQAWRRAEIVSLNSWLRRAWCELWPAEALAATPVRLRLFWSRSAALCPPSAPLEATPALLAQLDEAYEVLVRHGLDPCRQAPGPPLAEWRAQLSGHFERSMHEAGLLHPAHLPARLTEALLSGRLRPPQAVTLAGVSAPAPAEERLFTALSQRCRLTRLVSVPHAPRPRLVSLPRPKDEAEWCAREVLEAAQGLPLHEIGVAVPSMDDYGPLLERALREALGPRCGEGWSAYNLAAPRPLAEAPLVRAALLPLRFAAEEEPRELLLSLLTSPYYGRWQGVRALAARADRRWRTLSIERGLRRLLATAGGDGLARLIEGGPPTLSESLSILAGRATLGEWIGRLRELWRRLRFPRLAEEPPEAGVRDSLAKVLERLDLSLGDEVFGLRELYAFLEQSLAEEQIDVPGFEHAGVQVLGMLDAAGLHFARLLILGLHERGLPRPVRPLPLLRPDERKAVRGGTWESQLEFARAALANLLAAGRETCLVRPRLGGRDNGGEEPLLPSPLWPEGLEEERLWEGPAPRWIGSPWFEAAGVEREAPPPGAAGFRAPVALPGAVPATALEGLLWCPFAFLMAEVLGLEPLDDPRPGVSPLERGVRLHRALACLTRRLREEGRPAQEAPGLLAECVEAALEGTGRDPFWRLERRRWLGEGGPAEEGGLLRAWLAQEGANLTNCLAEEVEFAGLRHPTWPFEVRGKIDRLDAAGAGLACWDYKTGNYLASGHLPQDHPQLAAYGLAVASGRLAPPLGEKPLAGLGYVRLPSAGKVEVRPLREPEEGFQAALAQFAAQVGARAQAVGRGDFSPDLTACLRRPRRERERCPWRGLCGLLERLCGGGNGDEEAES